jgi:cobalt-zinc-cadmium efflux system membrane fusion protein
VLETRKRLGDPVEKDEVIAVIESNESLRPYDLRSLINGTVIAKNITVGEFVTESEKIYSIADLSTVWVDLNVYRRDFDKLREGQKLQIDAGEGVGKIEGSISYLSPFGAEHTQSLLARSVVQNPDGLLRPGVFVIGRVILGEPEVNVAVRQGAVQMLEEEKVVFVEEGDAFEARPVRLGRHDDEWVEVLDGLQPGERYAAKNSYIFKAELGKASAEHSH